MGTPILLGRMIDRRALLSLEKHNHLFYRSTITQGREELCVLYIFFLKNSCKRLYKNRELKLPVFWNDPPIANTLKVLISTRDIKISRKHAGNAGIASTTRNSRSGDKCSRILGEIRRKGETGMKGAKSR